MRSLLIFGCVCAKLFDKFFWSRDAFVKCMWSFWIGGFLLSFPALYFNVIGVNIPHFTAYPIAWALTLFMTYAAILTAIAVFISFRFACRDFCGWAGRHFCKLQIVWEKFAFEYRMMWGKCATEYDGGKS